MNRLNEKFSSSSSTQSMSSLKSNQEYEADDISSFNHSMSSSNNFLNNSKLYGEITLEMIDDFLNPLGIKKPSEYKATFKSGNLKSATNGFGLSTENLLNRQRIESTSSIASNTTNNCDRADFYSTEQNDKYAPFALKNKNDNENDYLKIRKQFERKLREQKESQQEQGNSNFRGDEASSVVGSSMSQIESVSTMSTSTAKKLTNRIRHCFDRLEIQTEVNEDLSFDYNNNNLDSVHNFLNKSSDFDFKSDEDKKQAHLNELIEQYTFRKDYDPKLPITALREKIIDQIENSTYSNNFCIIQGGTGCGKTTQVPQFILDHCMKEKKYCNIIVTQPRRIAAVSISRRVCQERGWTLGTLCGYQIGLERSYISPDTRITYCTTGVLLQKLIGPQSSENFNSFYTHIILDEVHERDLDIDFVMLLIKLQSFGRLKAKIILMSATIDVEIFREYFSLKINRNLNIHDTEQTCVTILAPLIEISSKIYNVREFYWEDLTSNNSFLNLIINQMIKEKNEKNKRIIQNSNSAYVYDQKGRLLTIDSARNLKQQMQNIQFNREEPEMFEETMMMCIALLKYFDEQDIRSIQSNNYSNDDQDGFKSVTRIIEGLPEVRGSVLIFVPGMEQIKQLQELINKELPFDEHKIDILPLHSDIVIEQQNLVFEKPQPTHRKVIISTSIAESSITVPDIKYVIDFCLTKELFCDPYTNYTHLRVEWASISNIDQRRGRAGRVSDGTCFRLIPKKFLKELDKFSIPAILREPLDKLILNVKRLDRKDEPKKILSMAIQPPKMSDIERTVLLLKEVGALTLKCKHKSLEDEDSTYNGDLTYVGKIMANLPIDVRLTKLILLGHTFGKLREAVIIAAALSTKTFFTCYYKSHLESFKSKWIWSGGWSCDCILILNAYNLYEHNLEKGVFAKRGEAERWAKKNMIEIVRIREVEKLKKELYSRLRTLGIECNRHIKLRDRGDYNPSNNIYDIDDDDDLNKNNMIIKMILAGAFYPNYFNDVKIDLQESVKMVGGHDLKNTVQIKNLPPGESILYIENLKDLFKVCANSIEVYFEDTKAYIKFSKSDKIASNVNLGVYLAVQMRMLRLPLHLNKLSAKETNERLKVWKQKLLDMSSSQIISHSIDSKLGFKFNLSMSTSTLNESFNESLIENDEDEVKTITESDIENYEEEYKKFLNPDSFVNEERNKYLSYFLTENSLNKSICSNVSSRLNRSHLASSEINISMNRAATCLNSLVSHLRNPRYLLPAEVNQGKFIKISITEMIECGHFYAQINDTHHTNTMYYIHDTLNKDNYNFNFLDIDEIFEDSLCITDYYEDNLGKAYYRARITNVNFESKQVQVYFIDYGNTATRKFNNLFKMSDELKEYPFQAVECKIYDLKPSLFKNPNGVWTKKSNEVFKVLLIKEFKELSMKVLDLDENLALVKLVGDTYEQNTVKDISDILVKIGYAEKLNKNEMNFNLQMQKFSRPEFYYIPTRETDFLTAQSRYTNIDADMRRLVIEKQNKQATSSINHKKQSYENENEDKISEISSYTYASKSSFNFKSNLPNPNNNETSTGYIEIRGPYSPLECSYHSLLNVGQSKRVRVERDSMNYVTLNTDPTNETNQLLVSHEVTLNAEGSTMILRKTSLMPKIPGLTSICCLLFSPTVELRVNEQGTRYTGALCGLGYDDYNDKPIYTDNDIECNFDINIETDDLIMINAVRLAINMVIGSEDGVNTWTNDESNLRKLQQKACEKLLKVLSRSREPIEPTYFKRPYKWNQVDKTKLIDLMVPESGVNINDDYCYYKLHKAVELSE